MNTRPTPETIAESFYDSPPEYEVVSGEFARRLERERDEARGQRDRLAAVLETITITGSAQYCREIADNALQSLTPNEKP